MQDRTQDISKVMKQRFREFYWHNFSLALGFDISVSQYSEHLLLTYLRVNQYRHSVESKMIKKKDISKVQL